MRESAGDEFTQPMLQALLAELKQISSVQAKHDQILLKLQQQQEQQQQLLLQQQQQQLLLQQQQQQQLQ